MSSSLAPTNGRRNSAEDAHRLLAVLMLAAGIIGCNRESPAPVLTAALEQRETANHDNYQI